MSANKSTFITELLAPSQLAFLILSYSKIFHSRNSLFPSLLSFGGNIYWLLLIMPQHACHHVFKCRLAVRPLCFMHLGEPRTTNVSLFCIFTYILGANFMYLCIRTDDTQSIVVRSVEQRTFFGWNRIFIALLRIAYLRMLRQKFNSRKRGFCFVLS